MLERSHALPELQDPPAGPDPSGDLDSLLPESQRREEPPSGPAAWAGEARSQLDYFGFTTHPFSDVVNPQFFYGSSVHEQAFKKMLMTVEGEIALGLVHGASGTGKTLLTQMLLNYLNPQAYEPALVLVSPGMSKTALLKEILAEILPQGTALPAQTQALLDRLHGRMAELHSQGKKLVILIDEAHFLSAGALHLLRTISNLEAPDKKLAACLLFAEELFLRRLTHPSYQSLRTRIFMKVPLTPMRLDETVQYIKFRLLAAGRRSPLIEEEAFHEIHKVSGGICREINRVCHNSLAEAFLAERETVDREVVRRATA